MPSGNWVTVSKLLQPEKFAPAAGDLLASSSGAAPPEMVVAVELSCCDVYSTEYREMT